MANRDSLNWMLAEAVESLARAERMHRQVFSLRSATRQAPAWEPPIDMIETEHEVLVLVALPGVDPEQVEATIEDGAMLVSGRRTLPSELRDAVIHRLELPQGRFERRIPLPGGRYSGVRRGAAQGCLVFRLAKSGRSET
ncbi:Hsp20/alpha crystallin family protein [Hansschlegelia zhihuaiae]|uniref:Hsp20/alpha crystallin family protein n=1 Tax=Hansschlegelia zhihuaiae TaxID=405005 RepID=A0A4Q0MR26_9HYPH|nr:Hsp20/alpha crystallin family protein [Hansschlegelia zhihuaiae]RXF75596.1 Hsp20/alpha crystallin family protein [Hansschlegelia zhihuaiae]